MWVGWQNLLLPCRRVDEHPHQEILLNLEAVETQKYHVVYELRVAINLDFTTK